MQGCCGDALIRNSLGGGGGAGDALIQYFFFAHHNHNYLKKILYSGKEGTLWERGRSKGKQHSEDMMGDYY